MRWAREKLDELVEMGEEEGVFEEVLVCLLCGGGVGAVTFNDFVRHMMGHAKVESVEMGSGGNVIHLADGRVLLPSDYVRKRVR